MVGVRLPTAGTVAGVEVLEVAVIGSREGGDEVVSVTQKQSVSWDKREYKRLI